RLAAGLRRRGVGGADHVAILMDNSPDCVLAWLASSLIGCTEVPVNTQYTGELLAYLLRDSGATVAICDARYLEALAAVAGGLPELRLVVARGDGPRPAGLDPVPLAECLGDGPPVRGETGPGRIILYT